MGERIRQLRKYRKLSQAELAEKLEVTQGFIGHIEKGRNQPTVEILARISIIFDRSMTWLVTGKEEASHLDVGFSYETGSDYAVGNDLREMLQRILEEGDVTKLSAVRGILAVYDPSKSRKGK